MKASCPKNPDHKRFVTVAHITQDWVVNEHGEFEDVHGSDGEVVADPNPDNTWNCHECGALAEVTD